MPQVQIQIVTWNSERYIVDCLRSLLAQTYQDCSVIVIDNKSSDKTVAVIREHFPTVTVLQNVKNQGFSKANNQGVRMAKGEYVFLVNPDIILEPECVSELVNAAESHPGVGSVCGKLLRLKSQAVDESDQTTRESIVTNQIDAVGIAVTKSRKAINRGEGQFDQGQFDQAGFVFGGSGACVLFRRSALEAVKIGDEYFDNDFFAYKEDIDLAWRLQLFGFQCYYTPTAIGYHYRGLAAHAGSGLRRNRKKTPKRLRIASFANHQLMLLKNEQLQNTLRHSVFIFGRTVGLLLYSLILEPTLWRAWVRVISLAPKMLRKRQVIMHHKTASPESIRQLFI